MKIRWKFGELKWNHSNVRALTNKQTNTETDADEISTAIRFAAAVMINATTRERRLHTRFDSGYLETEKYALNCELTKILMNWSFGFFVGVARERIIYDSQ